MLAKLQILKFRRLAWILLHKAMQRERESVLLTIPSSPIEKYNGLRLGWSFAEFSETRDLHQFHTYSYNSEHF
jgi:hypothetical protein